MEQKLKTLLEKYEKELKRSEESKYDDCYDCCDITAKGEYDSSLKRFISDLKEILK